MIKSSSTPTIIVWDSGQHVVNTWSTRGQHVINTWSTRGQHVVNTVDVI